MVVEKKEVAARVRFALAALCAFPVPGTCLHARKRDHLHIHYRYLGWPHPISPVPPADNAVFRCVSHVTFSRRCKR
jgi:hypothetical protein